MSVLVCQERENHKQNTKIGRSLDVESRVARRCRKNMCECQRGTIVRALDWHRSMPWLNDAMSYCSFISTFCLRNCTIWIFLSSHPVT